jgi:hypothetical protein
MIDEEFVRLLGEVFPSIDPQVKTACLEAARKEPVTAAELFATQLPAKMCQGDIVANLPFVIPYSDGSLKRSTGPAMLLSQSCDWDNDEFVSFAPAYPFDWYSDNPGMAGYIKRNEYFRLFYLPAVSGLGERVVEFSQAQPFRKDVVERSLADGSAVRQCSLTRIGFCYLIAKLTMHYMRPEPSDVARGTRDDPLSLRERVYEARRRVGPLIRLLRTGRR